MSTEKAPWSEAAKRHYDRNNDTPSLEEIIREACEAHATNLQALLIQYSPGALTTEEATKLHAELEQVRRQFGVCGVCGNCAWEESPDSSALESCQFCELRAELDIALRDYKVYAEENERLHRICVNREESLERAQRQAAVFRTCIQSAMELIKKMKLIKQSQNHDAILACLELEKALATDAGQDFVPIDDVRPLVEAALNAFKEEKVLQASRGESVSVLIGMAEQKLSAWASKHDGKEAP